MTKQTENENEGDNRTGAAPDTTERGSSDSQTSLSRRGTLASLVGVSGLGVVSNPVGAALGSLRAQPASTAATAVGPQYGHTVTFSNPEPNPGDEFGREVALSADGQTALVGAPGDWIGDVADFGEAYIFTRTADGWNLDDPVVLPNPDQDDHFGNAVALSTDGNTALVGAHLHPGDTPEKVGEAYVFTRTESGWDTENPVALPNPEPDHADEFGADVALDADGTTALVGAPGNDPEEEWDPGEGESGAGAGDAYIFVRTDGGWQTDDPVLLPNTEVDGTDEAPVPTDRFGDSVALSGDGSIALIGIPGERPPGTDPVGEVQIFTRSEEGWENADHLTTPNPDPGSGDRFGADVGLTADGRTAIVGAPGDLEDKKVYIFTRTDGGWDTENPVILSNPETGEDTFGAAVEISADGQTALVGAPTNISPGREAEAGAAYAFTQTDAGWQTDNPVMLSDPNPDPGDRFGSSEALSADGSAALVGAYSQNTDEFPNVGEVYLFERDAENGDGGEQPAVTFEEQDSDGTSVVVQSATLPEGGFLVIHDESGAVLGHSAYLDAGTHSNVEVTLDDSITSDQTLIAMAHTDDGDQTYEFPDADGPYTIDGEPVTDDASTLIC